MIGCFERYGELIDWAMLILNPFEPWPGELALDAAARHDVKVITRVVDYGGLFHDDVLPGHQFEAHDHRGFRPEGWVEAGRERLERIRPIADRHGLTPLQLACVWNLAHDAVECVAPTLIQEPGRDAKPIERKREELAAVPAEPVLSDEEVAEIRTVGDNRGSMLLKGATPDHEGEERPDRWAAERGAGRAGRPLGHRPRAGSPQDGSAGLGRLQQLGAALEGLGVLRARLVEAVRVLLNPARSGVGAVAARLAWRVVPCRAAAEAGEARRRPPSERRQRSESGRGVARAPRSAGRRSRSRTRPRTRSPPTGSRRATRGSPRARRTRSCRPRAG